VKVDETFIGGEEPGPRGGRQRGKKNLAGIAVEVAEPRGTGRCRMQILADGSAESVHPFVTASIAPGTRVITYGWQSYAGLARLGYFHERRSQRAARARGEDPGKLLPAVHRVASLAKRWLLGTHQGSVDDAHLADPHPGTTAPRTQHQYTLPKDQISTTHSAQSSHRKITAAPEIRISTPGGRQRLAPMSLGISRRAVPEQLRQLKLLIKSVKLD
jgi:hypothetical protein